jgi:hypothetical protein
MLKRVKYTTSVSCEMVEERPVCNIRPPIGCGQDVTFCGGRNTGIVLRISSLPPPPRYTRVYDCMDFKLIIHTDTFIREVTYCADRSQTVKQ